MKQKFYLVLTLTTIALLIANYFLSGEGQIFNRQIILGGTLFLYLVTLLSFFLTVRLLNHENPNKFVRGVMSGTMLKFFVCMIAAIVVLFTMKGIIHKQDIFLLMFVYAILTSIETIMMAKLSRQSST